ILSQSKTVNTTGHGHQTATRAIGSLTFYNGSNTAQTIHAGTVFTGRDGIQVATTVTVTIPANKPPLDGQATIPAYAEHPGASGNIAAGDMNLAISSDLSVRNVGAFHGGQDARYFSTVSAQDMHKLSTQLIETLTPSMQGALT